MAHSFIDHIANEFGGYGKKLLLVRNPDGLLSRGEIKNALIDKGVRIWDKEGIHLRFDFELNFKRDRTLTLYVCSDPDSLLEDIRNEGFILDFRLSDQFPEYYKQSIARCDLTLLEQLFDSKPLQNLNKRETESHIKELLKTLPDVSRFDYYAFENEINTLLDNTAIDWHQVILILSNGILGTVGRSEHVEVMGFVN